MEIKIRTRCNYVEKINKYLHYNSFLINIFSAYNLAQVLINLGIVILLICILVKDLPKYNTKIVKRIQGIITIELVTLQNDANN